MKPKQTRRAESVLEGFCFDIGENKIENKSKATEICRMRCLLSQMFTLDSKHTPSRQNLSTGRTGNVRSRKSSAVRR